MRDDDHDRPTEQRTDSHPGRDTSNDPGNDPGCGSGPDAGPRGGGGLFLPTGPGAPDPHPDAESGPDSELNGGPDGGVLETAERAAEWLTRGPAPLRTPPVPGLPGGLDLRAMAVQMRSGRLTDSQLQAVWSEIISAAQTETRATGRGSTWTVAAAGLAVPELASITSRVARTYPGPLSDLEAAALAGFVAELHRTTALPGLLRTGTHGVPRLLHAAESACRRLADTLAPAAWITGSPHRTGHARRSAGPVPAVPTAGPDTSGPEETPEETAAARLSSTPPSTPRSTPAAGAHTPPAGDTASPRRGSGPAADEWPASPRGGDR